MKHHLDLNRTGVWSALVLFTLGLLAGTPHALSQGTALSYQGRLDQNGPPANGFYDLVFVLFGTNSGGVAVAPGQTNLAVAINNGLHRMASAWTTVRRPWPRRGARVMCMSARSIPV